MIDFDTFRELIESGDPVCIKVKGNSMMPFLKNNEDSVVALKTDGRLKVGDVVFYLRLGSVVVMHRIVKLENDKMWLCGDAQQTPEGPLNVDRVFAKVVSVVHNGKSYDENSAYYKFYSKIWMKLTLLRPYILKILK